MTQLLAIAQHIYLIDPSSGTYKEYNKEDWSSTTAATLIPSTHKVYATTVFNNLWEVSLREAKVRKISWDGWGTCNALVAVHNATEPKQHSLFAFCHKLWLVDDPPTGHCTDFLGGFTDVWARVNAATSVGHKIYATTSANNLWCVDTQEKQVTKLGGGWDTWSTCCALVEVHGRLYAFCYGLYEVDLQTGKATPFFRDDDDADSEAVNRSWSNVKCATAIGSLIYVISGSKLVKVDTVDKTVIEVSGDNWGSTKALMAVDQSIIGDI